MDAMAALTCSGVEFSRSAFHKLVLCGVASHRNFESRKHFLTTETLPFTKTTNIEQNLLGLLVLCHRPIKSTIKLKGA